MPSLITYVSARAARAVCTSTAPPGRLSFYRSPGRARNRGPVVRRGAAQLRGGLRQPSGRSVSGLHIGVIRQGGAGIVLEPGWRTPRQEPLGGGPLTPTFRLQSGAPASGVADVWPLGLRSSRCVADHGINLRGRTMML